MIFPSFGIKRPACTCRRHLNSHKYLKSKINKLNTGPEKNGRFEETMLGYHLQ
jgi:hypothetical protein